MQDEIVELAERGRALSAEDRSRLVDLLLESLAEEPRADVESAWDAEVERRLAAYDRGEVAAADGEQVLARAKEISER